MKLVKCASASVSRPGAAAKALFVAHDTISEILKIWDKICRFIHFTACFF